MWVILQSDYRTRDVSGCGTSHVGPARKLTAVCRTAAGTADWLRRLERWAAEGVGRSYHTALIQTYEALCVGGPGDRGPAPCGPE